MSKIKKKVAKRAAQKRSNMCDELTRHSKGELREPTAEEKFDYSKRVSQKPKNHVEPDRDARRPPNLETLRAEVEEDMKEFDKI